MRAGLIAGEPARSSRIGRAAKSPRLTRPYLAVIAGVLAGSCPRSALDRAACCLPRSSFRASTLVQADSASASIRPRSLSWSKRVSRTMTRSGVCGRPGRSVWPRIMLHPNSSVSTMALLNRDGRGRDEDFLFAQPGISPADDSRTYPRYGFIARVGCIFREKVQ